MPNAESRYVRQIRFAPFGEEGQKRVHGARVAIVGLGALGSVQAELLARAGVGRLRLIDRDFVELGNLQRQFLYDEADAEEAVLVAGELVVEGGEPPDCDPPADPELPGEDEPVAEWGPPFEPLFAGGALAPDIALYLATAPS